MESKVKKILKIGASWCGPCRQLKKELEDFNLVSIDEIDADENEQLCSDYNVKSIPLLILLGEDGKEIARHVGFITKKELIDLIDNLNR